MRAISSSERHQPRRTTYPRRERPFARGGFERPRRLGLTLGSVELFGDPFGHRSLMRCLRGRTSLFGGDSFRFPATLSFQDGVELALVRR